MYALFKLTQVIIYQVMTWYDEILDDGLCRMLR